MLIVLGGCSNGNEVAGTGSSTGNAKIAGVILSEDGTPAANSVVYLIPENYNPIEKNHSDEIMIDTVDSDGYYSFEFEDSTSDAYNIDAMGIAEYLDITLMAEYLLLMLMKMIWIQVI